MKFVHQTHDQLTLQLLPVFIWGTCLVLLILAVILKPFVAKLFLIGFGLLLIFGLGETAVCRFNKTTGQVLLKRWNLLGSKRVRSSIREVRNVEVQISHSSENDTYRVCILLTEGEIFPLTTYYSGGLQEKQDVAETIRHFLNLPDLYS